MKRFIPTGFPWVISLLASLLPPDATTLAESPKSPESPKPPKLESATDAAPLPGTDTLDRQGDLSQQLVTANDAFLDARLAAARESRPSQWRPGDYDPEERRTELAEMLGLPRDERPEDVRLEFLGIDGPDTRLAETDRIVIHTVRWPAVDGVHGAGLLLVPKGDIRADVLAVPDADILPETIAGLTGTEAPVTPYALRLARLGCRVLVPALVDRSEHRHGMPNREWLYRPAFELGRQLLGYELHQVLAGLDALENGRPETAAERPVGIVGWGEGGLHSLYATALDPRFDAAAVSGYFGPRVGLWKEPAEHNVFGLLERFGDAGIAALVAPRALVIESGVYPDFAFRPGDHDGIAILEERPEKDGKPGRFFAPSSDEVKSELKRLDSYTANDWSPTTVETEEAVSPPTQKAFLTALDIELPASTSSPEFERMASNERIQDHAKARHADLVAAIERHHQRALIQSRQDRAEFFDDLETEDLESFEGTIEPYRKIFREDVVGEFDLERVDPNPRSRPHQEGPETISYQVVLDVFGNGGENQGGDEGDAGVFAYGILTLPKDLDPASAEPRPVVVCQHGLEGFPQQVVGEQRFRNYGAFATRLAERGFVTFAPQNGYKYYDLFRLQQFKAQSLGKTLFSLIVPQHRQITDWLASLSFVDGERIGFYGLSYGGKSAMRIPPLVDRYALSICSADFNEWVWKNAAIDEKSLRYSYANKGEYEIFEWNLGGTFNYSEMAALICPRPFMVERGHFDGVAPDETVAYEFAKVRHLYQAELGIGDRCEIEWFVGPHSINGEGTFRFLHEHLDWPQP